MVEHQHTFMKVLSCAISDVGRKRQKNEDGYLINDALRLYMVADGMGGHAGGEYASRIAITTVESHFKREMERKEQPHDPDAIMRDSILDAGVQICQKAAEDASLRGMGTTTVALHLVGDKAYVGHVGDSRAYHVRDGKIERLTDDHSLVNEQLKSGLITEEEARTHQFKNIITRSVGVGEDVEVDILNMDIKPHDIFLMCSDGLSNLVEQREILQQLLQNDHVMAAKNLVDLANKRGGDDNITLIIVSILEGDE